MATPEAAAEAVAKGGMSFTFFLFVLVICASLAGFLIFVQKKRSEESSLLQGIDNQYEEMMDQLQQLADDFDAVLDREPNTRQLRIALIKRARGVLPIVQAVQRELQQKEGMLREGTVRKEDFENLVALKDRVEEEISEIKARSDEVKPGLGEKVFKMVQGQQYQLIFAVEKNLKEYNEVAERDAPAREKKLTLIVKRGLPVLEYLAQLNKIPLENLRKEEKIDEEEYENFMSLKEFLEEEKAGVEQEAELIQKGYTDVMLRLIEHQKQLFNLCRQVDQIVREYESFVDDENMSPRQKILALVVRRAVAIRKYDQDLQRAAEQVEALHKEGKVDADQYEIILSVKDRMEAAMAATRREGNKLKKGLGAKLEAIYDAQTENYKQVIMMEQRLVEYSTAVSQAANLTGEINPQIRLKLLFEKRLLPAIELDKKLSAEQARLEGLRNEGKGDSHELEAFMGIKERVMEELENIREEADEIETGAAEALFTEANNRLQSKAKQDAAAKARERKPDTIQERLKKKSGEIRSSPSRSSSGSLGNTAEQEDEAEKLAREAEAERIAAELLKEMEEEELANSKSGSKKSGGKKGAKKP